MSLQMKNTKFLLDNPEIFNMRFKMNRYDCDKEKLQKEYGLALKEFTIEKEEREEIYRECRAIDKTLMDCLGYCNETELMEEELAEFKKQSDREMKEKDDKLISLKKKIRDL